MAHKHHIKPRYMGGTDNPSNLIEVTTEEHALIHYNRWMIYGKWQDKLAYRCLSGQIGKEEIQRELSKQAGIKTASLKIWEGRKHKPESIQKIRESRAKQIITEESKYKRSITMKGMFQKVLCKPVIINGIKYISESQASQKLQIPISTISYRLTANSRKFQNWNFIKGVN